MLPMMPRERCLECLYAALAGFAVILYFAVLVGLHCGSRHAGRLVDFLDAR